MTDYYSSWSGLRQPENLRFFLILRVMGEYEFGQKAENSLLVYGGRVWRN